MNCLNILMLFFNHILQKYKEEFIRSNEYYISSCTKSKACVKRTLKNRQNKDLNDKWQLNEGQKYCRMLILQYFRPSLSYHVS